MKNRLKLNFQLETAEERSAFVDSYLKTINFVPNEQETETISNYILWGKNTSGRNIQQEKLVELKKWAPLQTESIEGLMEIPGFQESAFHTLREAPPKIKRKVFDRAAALQNAPDYLVPIFQDLFRQIDTIELILNFYELGVGKRAKPPRNSLISKFSEEEQIQLRERAEKLTQYKYLKMRHLLVELRAQQYDYYDTYSNRVVSHGESISNVVMENQISIGEDVDVLPVGLKENSGIQNKMFSTAEPQDYAEEELRQISDLLWAPKKDKIIDFTKEEHIYALYQARADLIEQADRDPESIYGVAKFLLDTLQYYEDQANLSDLQKEILELKLNKVQNLEIARYINEKYGKTYNDNYISTIYRQKILGSIAAAARAHKNIIENIFYPENFKRCKDCGRLLLLSPDNFMRQKKSKDGFSPRCKSCEKIKRDKRKNQT